MTDLLIQIGLLTFVGYLIASFIIGGSLVWLILRFRSKRLTAAPASETDVLYLMFSRLSHRLKTVGEVIRGQLHGFSDELPSDPERWRVARKAVMEEASEVNSLTQRLDLMVRMGMSGQPLVMEPVNVPALLEDLIIDMGPAADAKGISLGGVVRNQGSEIPTISADEMALREVFSNLLENAVKYSGEGAEITAEVKQENGQLSVRIADNGDGMPQEILGSVFEKGNRTYNPGAARGTGMGLFLCKMLVELHGGQINASSLDEEGTEFLISLPLRRSK